MSKENKRQVGTKYEKLAGTFLEEQGCEILCYNYRCFFGEIDIVAKEGNTLIFCEVKYRSSSAGGNPFEAVDPKKQQIIYRCAMNYLSFETMNSGCNREIHESTDHRSNLEVHESTDAGIGSGVQENKRDIPCRFDVIGFVGDEIYHVKNAFHG